MDRSYEPIRRFLQRVRARCRTVSVLDATMRAALATSAVVAVALAGWSLVTLGSRSPAVLASLAGAVLLLVALAVVWGLKPLRGAPTDAQLARLVEERVPALDDRLATALDAVAVALKRGGPPPMLLGPLVEDAARRVDAIALDDIVPRERLRRGGVKAGAAAVTLVVLAVMAREPARQSLDAASLALFPERIRLEVSPGDTRLVQGAALTIEARLAGNRAPVGARVEVSEGDRMRTAEMLGSGAEFRLSMSQVVSDFQYRVVAGSVASRTYRVTVARPPHVVRIDADYVFPASLGLPLRTETDGGDVYAPAGTAVTLHVFTDRPVASGQLSLANGQSISLAARADAQLTATLKVLEDGSYRVALRDRDGLADPGQTEYFIRALEDRPPDVHVVKPASDRSVTRLEEVDIEAQAEDDYGIDRMELVYAVRGQSEKIVPLDVPRRGTRVTARHTLYLEDLDVRPGDFVSYYVRARDVTRGTRPNEGRSDIFFLEVRPFEQEFALTQSQSMAGSGYNGSIDELVTSQKQIVVATWKLDRRGQNVKGAQSPADIHAIGRSEADLKARVEETASSLRESTMRDPRRRLQGRGGDASDGTQAGRTMPEEDAMTAAVEAMDRAILSLDALKTGAALPPEMQALNSLLEAQALVKKRQVSRQQSAQGGPGNNNRNYDISALFDKELQRLQETKYETRQASGDQNKENDAALQKIAELARRQDEMLRRQQDLARQHLDDAEMARQLEKLTREQAELRQQAEELARRMSKLESGRQNSSGPPAPSPSGNEQTARQLRDISDDMRSATNDLRRRDSTRAGSGGTRALEKLKALERRLGGGDKDEPRNASGSGKPRDAESRAMSEQRERARQLRQNIERVTRELEKLSQDAGRSSVPGGQRAPNQTGKAAERPDAASSGRGEELDRLRQQAGRELQRTRELIDELRRQDPSFASGGTGFTFEGAGMVFSSPGTEAFKQDFTKWQTLSAEATRALDRAESSLSKGLQQEDSAGRLAAGIDDKAPAAYQQQVDRYFKALGSRRQP
jgi:hypothetical protein